MNDHEYSLAPIQFDPFAGPEISKLINVIEPQAEIWASCLLGGEDANRSYNESVSLSLQGSLVYPALEKAIKQLIIRHEVLRSALSADGKQLCVYTELDPGYSFSDISLQSPARQKEIIEAFLSVDAQTSFELLTGPLFRVNLFKLNENEHHLTLSAHHIICDGWSMWVMMQDIGKLYSAFVKGENPQLNEAPSFSEYALQQKQFHSTEKYRQTEAYWLDQFRETIPVLDIPTDRPRPENRTYKSRRDDYSLDPGLTEALKKTGAAAGCSFVTTMLVAFEVFLYRISGQSDIVLGIPAAGQSLDDNQQLVGHCVNMLPLRSSPEGEYRFSDYLRKRKPAILDAYEHKQLTFGSLLKKLNIPRDPSRIPLIPIVFNIDSSMDEGVRFEGLNYTIRINKREYENFEIFLNASLSGNDLTLEWSYNTGLFEPQTIRRMMYDFESILYAIVENPESEIKDLPVKASDEFNCKLEERNNTAAAYPSDTPLHRLIEQAVLQHPDREALRFNHKTYTYRELNEASNRLAHYLLERKVGKGDLIGLVLERSADMLIAALAILKCGAAYIPIDPEYPQKRIEYMLSDSSARLLITNSRFKGRSNSGVKEVLIEEEYDAINSCSPENPDSGADSHTPAYVIYTSGSTGNPKGTIIEHRSLVNFLCSMKKAPGIKADDRLLSVTTISFDIAALELYLPLISGATVIIADSEISRDGRALLELLRSEDISVMQATPSTWKMMIEAGWKDPLDIKILCGGEALSTALADQLVSLSSSVWNMYGPTETTIWSLIREIKSAGEPITIGYPIDNTQVYILDKYLKPVMPGLAGEIYIAGDGLARGYLNRPELTARNFIPDPFDTSGGRKLYRTGDLGMFNAEGEIIFMGRIDNQIKLRGHRIEPDAIEHYLGQLKDIRECKVVLREDRPGDQRLAAYIIPEQPEQYLNENHDHIALSSSQFSAWKHQLGELLPSIMIPSEFVVLRKMPLLPNGKTDRSALPVPDSPADEGKNGRLPVTDIQKLIAKAWEETLGLQHITLDDDFFELGGHSLVAAQLMIRLEKETGIRQPFTALFRHSSLEQFSSLFSQTAK